MFSQDCQGHESGIVIERSQGHSCIERSICQFQKQATEGERRMKYTVVTMEHHSEAYVMHEVGLRHRDHRDHARLNKRECVPLYPALC